MNPQYEILAKCLLPTHIPIRAVRRCCCDKEAGRKSIKKWYAEVGEFQNKAFNDIAAAMYDREDEILNVFVKPNDQNHACMSFGMARKRALK